MSDPQPQIPLHFLVMIPGIMGSKLRNKKTGEIVWVDFGAIPKNPFQWNAWIDHLLGQMAYPNDDLEPAGVMDKLIFVPPWAKQEIYSRLVAALQEMGYKADPSQYAEADRTLYTFDYDWRQDNRKSAAQLADAVARWQSFHPGAKPWIVAHSNGGLVARWYIEKLGGKEHVGRLFLMGSPWDGSPKALRMLFDGVVLLRQWPGLLDIAERTRSVVRTWPAAYQLLPHVDPFLRAESNQTVALTDNLAWLDETGRALLADGLRFTSELDKATSVETLCFFGRAQPTNTGGLVHTDPGGGWARIDWSTTDAGDGTVPERAAVLPGSEEVLPFAVTHGEIYVNPDVLQKLQWELIGKFQLGTLAEMVVGGLDITFNPDKDSYAPGEPIPVAATVRRVQGGAAVRDADITARLVWRDALPGSAVTMADTATLRLAPSLGDPGRYAGVFTAPAAEGYYRVEATVTAPGVESLTLGELIAVEAPPGAVGAEVGADIEVVLAPPMPRPPAAGGEIDMVLGPPHLPVPPPSVDRGLDEGPPPIFGGSGGGVGVGAGGGDVTRGLEGEPGVLGGTGTGTGTGSGTAPAQVEAQRFLNAAIENQPDNEPLRVGQTYSLAFSVDGARAQFAAPLPEAKRLFLPTEDEIALTVRLDSQDFDIGPDVQQTLRLPRSGPSRAPARFSITPRQEGQGVISAVVLKDNNFVLLLTLKLGVGAAQTAAMVDVQPQSRPLAGAHGLQPRDLNLLIEPSAEGFKITATGAFVSTATLPLREAALAQMIDRTRQALFSIVDTKDPATGRKVYQSGIDIPADINRQSLKALARVGWGLYQGLFFGPAADAQANKLGTWLRRLAQTDTLKIQIVSNQFLMPWGLLYVADRFDENNVQPEMFLGLKHIIEHLPLQTADNPPGQTIPSQPTLTVSVNVNKDIDTQFHTTIIADQVAFWSRIKDAGLADVVVRATRAEVVQALADTATPDQIVYFYCHASAPTANDPLGPAGASLFLTGGEPLTLDDLQTAAPTTDQLAGAPLVFINACESADLSPLFYNGFMPYLVRKGARGMIGTECQAPALFAESWAEAFFGQFLKGETSLGQIFLDLRRDFYFNHKNLLGLLYALYCNGDTQVVPGLKLV
ncbi:MAG: CHAT domain-containing protein [Anaerolineae bacterium]